MLQYPDIFNTCLGRIANETAAVLLLWMALIQNQRFPFDHNQNVEISSIIIVKF